MLWEWSNSSDVLSALICQFIGGGGGERERIALIQTTGCSVSLPLFTGNVQGMSNVQGFIRGVGRNVSKGGSF